METTAEPERTARLLAVWTEQTEHGPCLCATYELVPPHDATRDHLGRPISHRVERVMATTRPNASADHNGSLRPRGTWTTELQIHDQEHDRCTSLACVLYRHQRPALALVSATPPGLAHAILGPSHAAALAMIGYALVLAN